MNRKQIIIIALVAVTFLLLAASMAVLARALSQTREVAERRDGKFSELQAIYRAPVFPDRNNIDLYRRETGAVVEWTTNVLAAQREVVQFDDSLTPSQFMQVLQPAIRDFSKIKNRGGSRVVADNFAFGFDSYISGGQMPAAADVPKLTLQLEIIKRLCNELFESNVASIRQLTRQQFESAVAEEAAPVVEEPRGRRSRTRLPGKSAEPVAPGRTEKRAIVGTHPFTIEFTARKEALQSVLNRLAATEMFVTVTRLSVAKAAPDVRAVPDGKKEELKESEAPMRVIAGPEIDPLLVVRLNLTVEIF